MSERKPYFHCPGTVHVACRPFPVAHVQAKKVGGLAFGNQSHELTSLEVVVGNRDIPSGLKALVRADQYTQPWAKLRLSAAGIEGEFILVPTSEILLTET